MRRFQLNKLVRDRVFIDMQRRGQRVEWSRLDNLGQYRETGRKVGEETSEVDPSLPREVIIKEMADRREVLRAAAAADKALAKELGISNEEIEAARQKRRKEMGGFAGGIFVQTVTLAEDDPFVEYYAGQPKRFPELPVEPEGE